MYNMAKTIKSLEITLGFFIHKYTKYKKIDIIKKTP